MFSLHPRLLELIDYRLKGSVKNLTLIPDGSDLWMVDSDSNQWVISISSSGILKYNLKFFNDIFAVFSLKWDEYQTFLKGWFEKIIKVPIRQIQRVSGDMSYVLDKIKKRADKWSLNKRFEFSYKVVKEYLERKDIYEEVKLFNYF
jgi:hypothetical protein